LLGLLSAGAGKHYSLVSQTMLRISQDQALVELGHLCSFYKCALEKKNGTDIF